MGWRDQAIPANAPSAAPATPAAPATDTPAATGWRSQAVPANAPATPAPKPATYDDASALGVAGDTAYRAANTGTLGLLDYANAGIHALGGEGYSDSLAKIHQQNDEWQAAHPYLSLGADVVGYGAGLGKIGIGARVAERLGGKFAARIAGGATENVGTGLVADELNSGFTAHEKPYEMGAGALLNGIIGGVAGGLPGSRGKMADAGKISPAAGLGTDTANAFRPLETTHYDPSVIGNDFSTAVSKLKASQGSGLGGTLDTQIDKISQNIANKQKLGQSVTADDITKFQLQLNNAAKGDTDIRVAKQLGSSLDNTMQTQRPLFTQLSGPAEIAQRSKDARAAALKENINSDIEDWMNDAQSNLPKTQAAMKDKVTASPQFYPNVGSSLLEASKGPGLGGKILQEAMHPIGDALASGAVGFALGERDPGALLATTIAGGAGGAAARHGLATWRTNRLLDALKAAREQNLTGRVFRPEDFRKGYGPMAEKIYGGVQRVAPALGASGRFGG